MKQNNFTIQEFKSIYYKKGAEKFEYDVNGNLSVSEKVFDEIKQFVLKNSEQTLFLKPSYKSGIGEVLQAQNYVGIIQTKGGITIEILPKIQNLENSEAKKILVKMLKTLKKSPFKNFNMANLKNSKMPLFEIFITMYLEELSKLIRKGLKSDYITKEENLKFLKGKLKINDQVKKNYIHKERFYVQYQEFTSDRVENKLIKTTLNYLYKKSTSNKNQQKIREFLFVFDEIDISHNIKADFSKIKLNRQMKDYEQVLLWCRTFLLENSFSPYRGNDVAFALLFDMNLLFESYVYYYLKRSGKFDDIKAQDKTHHLAYLDGATSKFQLRPDIVIDGGKIILDTKWKILSEDRAHQGISQADMYQLYAYGTKYQNCEFLYLIYPYSGENIKNSYQYFDKNTVLGYKEDGNWSEKGKLHLNILFFDVRDDKPTFYNSDYTDGKNYKLYSTLYKQT